MLAAIVAGSLLIGGCGSGSGSGEDSVQARIDEARREGALAAHRRERMAELQRRVARLERRTREGAASTQAAPAPATAGTVDTGGGPSILRLFHAPSGNIACAILTDGATCSVTSANKTFVLETDTPAWTEPGLAFAGESGEPAAYGATVSAGAVNCAIPAANEQRGITCTDSDSGHGFEASRVESRQRTF